MSKKVLGNNLSTIAERFKYLREEKTEGKGKKGKSLTLRELAEELLQIKECFVDGQDYNHSKIQRLEKGKGEPTRLDFELYHKYFNVPYEFLFGESNNFEYQNVEDYRDIGLSDKAIERLKYMNNPKNNYKEYIDLINCIFDSDLDNEFWNLLIEYFFGDIRKVDIGDKLIDEKATYFNVNIVLNKNRVINKTAFNLEQINSIYKLTLHKKLDELKTKLIDKGYRKVQNESGQYRIYTHPDKKLKETSNKEQGKLAHKIFKNKKNIKNKK